MDAWILCVGAAASLPLAYLETMLPAALALRLMA
jgi:hypothetical protein